MALKVTYGIIPLSGNISTTGSFIRKNNEFLDNCHTQLTLTYESFFEKLLPNRLSPNSNVSMFE